MLDNVRIISAVALTMSISLFGTPRSEPSIADPPSPVVVAHSGGKGSDATANIGVSVKSRPSSRNVPGSGSGAKPPGDAQIGPPDPCFYLPKTSAETVAAGYDPSKRTLSLAKCPVQSNLPGLPDGVRYVTHDVWTLSGEAPAAPPPPDPAELAQSVAAQLTVPAPVVHVGAGERVAVKVPVWLWVDEQPALTASVTAGGLTVSATAVLTSTDWSMGDPVSDPDEGRAAGVAAFTCAGAGQAPDVGVARSVTPPCGYTYIWRSDAVRTGGSGAWPVMVVAHWTMTWQATNGAQGTIPLQAQTAMQVPVGEWRVALVDGGGTH